MPYSHILPHTPKMFKLCNSAQLIVQPFNRFSPISPHFFMQAGDGMDVTFEMQNENENQDHDDTHEDAQACHNRMRKWCSLKKPNLVSQWACLRHFATMWFNCSAFCHLTSCEFSAQFLKCFVSASDSTKFIKQFDCCVIDILALLKMILPRKHHKADCRSLQDDPDEFEEVAEEIEVGTTLWVRLDLRHPKRS